MSHTVSRGDVVLVNLDGVGHEQLNRRPCIVVSADEIAQELRFPLVVVVPLTTTRLGPFYPVIGPYGGGLTGPSTALVDNIRGIDKIRIVRVYSPVRPSDMLAVERAMARLLSLKLA